MQSLYRDSLTRGSACGEWWGQNEREKEHLISLREHEAERKFRIVTDDNDRGEKCKKNVNK